MTTLIIITLSTAPALDAAGEKLQDVCFKDSGKKPPCFRDTRENPRLEQAAHFLLR